MDAESSDYDASDYEEEEQRDEVCESNLSSLMRRDCGF